MAYGYAKSTGRTGVYTVVPGPGVLNSSSALSVAYGANAPVLCVTGNIMSDLIGRGRGQLHELPDQLATLRGFTGWAERIDHATEAPRIVAEAFRQMHGGRVRPAAIEAPWDVFGKAAQVDLDVDRTVPPPPAPDADRIEEIAGLIREARNPLIVVGAGAQHASEEVGGARRADPGAGHQLPQRQGRGRKRQPLRAALQRGLRVLARMRPPDRHRKPPGAGAFPLALDARGHEDRPDRHRSDRVRAHPARRRRGHGRETRHVRADGEA